MTLDQQGISPTTRPKTNWIRYINIIVVVVIFYFLGSSFLRDISKAGPIKWSVNYYFLALSVVWMVVGLLTQVQVWKVNLETLGVSSNFKDIFKLVHLANMGRYVPGKIWSVLGLVYLSKNIAVPQASAILCSMISQITCVLAGFIFSGILLIGFSALGHAINLWWMIIPLALSLVFLHPYVYSKILKLIAKFTKGDNVEVEFPFWGIVKSTLMYMLVWFFHGISFSFLVLSLGDFSLKWLVYSLGIMPAAYLVGYLMLLSPGGWGIREGAMVLFLKEFMPQYLAITASVLSRLLFTVFEVVFFVIALRLSWSKNQQKELLNQTSQEDIVSKKKMQ